MPRVLLFGLGSIGGLYAYILYKAPGVELTTVCRSNYDAVKQHGLIVDSDVFGQTVCKPAAVVRSCEEATGPFDYVVVVAKALAGTAEKIKAAVGPKTAIALIQNGMFIEEEYRKLYPGRPIISCSVNAPVNQPEPGKIVHRMRERLQVGAYPKEDAAAQTSAKAFCDLIAAGGGTSNFFEDIQPSRWEKVAANTAFNPMTALMRLPTSYLWEIGRGEDEGMLTSEQLCREVFDEVGAIATAEGYDGPAIVKKTDEMILTPSLSRGLGATTAPSMLQDVRLGNRLEVEAILGNVVRRGRQLKVPTPRLDVLYLLAKGLDRSMAENFKDFYMK